MGIIRTVQLNKMQTESPEISVSSLGSELISLQTEDSYIFDDIIRTIDITLNTNCLFCDLLITTDEINPILYSDNDYTNPSGNTARFRIPDNPTKKMVFKYGAAKTP